MVRRRKLSHILNQYCIFSLCLLDISNVDKKIKLNTSLSLWFVEHTWFFFLDKYVCSVLTLLSVNQLEWIERWTLTSAD